MTDPHQDNPLFYTLTPELLTATVEALYSADRELMKSAAYYEFGLFKGFNLWFFHSLSPSTPCYGFDSFDGMPAGGTYPEHYRGAYRASMEEVYKHLSDHNLGNIPAAPIRLHKGWFSDEMFEALDFDFLPAGIVTIDCDLYASAVPVLRFIADKLRPGTIILFDDWKMTAPSEREAWGEFLGEHPGIESHAIYEFGQYGMAVQISQTGRDP